MILSEGSPYMVDIVDVLEERGKTYGTFMDNAQLGQELKAVIRNHYKWIYLKADQKQMIDVIFDKISRLVAGDPNYIDNYVDIEGYARLVRERLESDNVVRRGDSSTVHQTTCTEGADGEQAQAGAYADQGCDE